METTVPSSRGADWQTLVGITILLAAIFAAGITSDPNVTRHAGACECPTRHDPCCLKCCSEADLCCCQTFDRCPCPNPPPPPP